MEAFSSRDSRRILLGMLGFAAAIGGIWVLTQVSWTDSHLLANAAASASICRDALEDLVVDSEQGITVGAVEYDELGARCSAEYEVWTDFVYIRAYAESHGPPPCAGLEHYGLEPQAVVLARQYDYCA